MNRATGIPIRMCLGCGERVPQSEMQRIVSAADGTLRAVTCSPQRGRSGYLHRNEVCLRRFASRKGPVRSLGRTIDRETRLALVGTLEGVRRARGMR